MVFVLVGEGESSDDGCLWDLSVVGVLKVYLT